VRQYEYECINRAVVMEGERRVVRRPRGINKDRPTHLALPHPVRFPRYTLIASAAEPEEMCTGEPPAKSSPPRTKDLCVRDESALIGGGQIPKQNGAEGDEERDLPPITVPRLQINKSQISMDFEG
jgi:hypothetical protein